ncbi:protein LYK5 [Andrographis paniculata]|uniref:protein LYK5 n=1 Tax=Andrographis paniculata TaxID=175694 RepID=UPI0021E961A5|nr:protein LYK5 [Andrographis paniculata]
MAVPPPPRLAVLLLLLLVLVEDHPSEAQQSYINKKQLDCNKNHTATLGFVCNGAASSCPSFLTFRSTQTYNNPATIAYLLSADASEIAAANNISDVDPLPLDTLLVVPINCSCSQRYYQHNATYTLKKQGENYFDVANITYQGLTACQAMEAQNPYNFQMLNVGMTITIPLRCACPTRNQTAAGFSYLLTYLIRQGETYESIATAFAGAGADVASILTANELSASDLIYFFTPLLIPLKIEPTKQNINAVAPPPPPRPSAPPPNAPPAQGGGSDSNKGIFIGVGIGASLLLLLTSILLFWFLFYRHRRQHHKSPPPPPLPPKLIDESGESTTKSLTSWSLSSEGIRSATETLTIYKFSDLEKATQSFSESNRINNSSVYRASFNGDEAAVKIMKGDVSREINALRLINHSRILRLSGFCVHDGLTYLIYEYAENGSLSDWLHPGPKLQPLPWKQRIQIACDTADALNYLHNFTTPPYIHKNLTTSNILLDTTMRAKITNFGLSRTFDAGGGDNEAVITRHVVGTYGYMAPEYVESGLVTPKLDVYALGVVILELLSGREAVGGDQAALAEAVEEVLGAEENVREKIRDFMDPLLGEDYPRELAYPALQLARSCVDHTMDARPPVSEVLAALSKLLKASLQWDPSRDSSSLVLD